MNEDIQAQLNDPEVNRFKKSNRVQSAQSIHFDQIYN